MKNQGFVKCFQWFSFFNISPFSYQFSQFSLKTTHLSPRGTQMGSCWGPGAVPGGLLGSFFASLGPSGDPWAPPGGCAGTSWHHFPQFRNPKSSPRRDFHQMFHDFHPKNTIFSTWKQQIFTHICLPNILVFPHLSSPSYHFFLQSSQHPSLQASKVGSAECAKRLNNIL